MRPIVCAGLLLLLLGTSTSFAAPPTRITVVVSTGFYDSPGHRMIQLRLSDPVPRSSAANSLDSKVRDPANYVVLEGANPNGTTDTAIYGPKVNGRVISVTNVRYVNENTDEGRKLVVVELAGDGFASGTVQVRQMVAADGTIEGATRDWKVSSYPRISGASGDFKLETPNAALVLAFNYAYTTDWNVSSDLKTTTRQWYSLEGSVPITTPSDVQAVPGASVDASRIVADYFQASFTDRTYSSINNFSAWGITVRTSGRGNGLEAVARFQPWATLAPNGRSFLGAELETGYRDGRSEWATLTQLAPFRGNVVARFGTVIEWAPQLGPINSDLGSGLRFFVRGRGWADYAKNDSGQDGVRLRGFVDSELFYDISKDYRVFLRYELGALPPDLTRNVSTVMLGIGKAF